MSDGAPLARGLLFLVVGPSGAGKDTLIDAARAARPEISFAQRVITRPEEAAGEDHLAATPAAFEAAEAAGAYALSWRAHDLAYGVPVEALSPLKEGRDVLINVSRRVLDAARAAYGPVAVLNVVARPDVLAVRLAARGRETTGEIAARLARAAQSEPAGPDVWTIENSGPVDLGVAAFLAAISAARRQRRATESAR